MSRASLLLSFSVRTRVFLASHICDFDFLHKVSHAHDWLGTQGPLLISQLESRLDVAVKVPQHAKHSATLVSSGIFGIRVGIFDGGVRERFNQFRNFRRSLAFFPGLNELF
jgi:hypothetical protein